MSQTIVNEISGWGDWNASRYLSTYYASPASDTYKTLDFIVETLNSYKGTPFKKALEFGSGPTLFGALAVAPYVNELHVSDYLEKNLLEISKWVDNKNDAFNWDECTKYILSKEGVVPSPQNVINRSNDLKLKLTQTLFGDITKESPLSTICTDYDLVTSLFCAESITSSKSEWKNYIKNLLSLASPKGLVLVSALRNCKMYRVGDKYFPCANVNEVDLREAIIAGNNNIEDILIETHSVPDCENEGFVSIMFARVKLK